MKNFASLFRRNPSRVAGIVALIAVAILGIYRFAGGDTQAQAATSRTPGAVVTTGPVKSNAARSSGCCASGAPSTPVEGAAAVIGGIQKISVDLSSGTYKPNSLKLRAGVPAEITFGRSSGCTGYVQSADLGFQADLTSGPQTIKLPALQPGTYGFACGMGMVTGEIVVE
jgi:hypothetical protein